jgi:hypothetical protein
MLSELITWPFHDLLTGVNYPDALLGLEPSIDLDTTQTAGQIGFSLVLKNGNNSTAQIPNPIDFVQYMLLDARDIPFPEPPIPVRTKLSPEDWDSWENPYRPLICVLKNGTALPLDEMQRLKSIELGAADTYTFSFQIKGTPQVNTGNGQTEIRPLPPGRYSQNRLLQTEKIPIRLQ